MSSRKLRKKYGTFDGLPGIRRLSATGKLEVIYLSGTPTYRGTVNFRYDSNLNIDQNLDGLGWSNYCIYSMRDHFHAFNKSFKLEASTMEEAKEEYLLKANDYIAEVKKMHSMSSEAVTFTFNTIMESHVSAEGIELLDRSDA